MWEKAFAPSPAISSMARRSGMAEVEYFHPNPDFRATAYGSRNSRKVEYANTLLNLTWLTICLAAFTWFLASTGRRHRCSQRALIGRAIALSLALISLFPCVSASDDSVRLELMNAQFQAGAPGHSHWSARSSSTELLATLVALLEVLESAQVTAILAFSVSLFLFALALAIHSDSVDRFLPACPGRAPPCGSPLAV
jgi:hypothetical protein